MTSNNFDIPILFLIFNRPTSTKAVFEKIKEMKPKKLYIACDGARKNKEGELEKVKLLREFIKDNVDWDCSLETLFRDSNLGCGKAVSSAIDWFFKNEEMGIILEDDCLPSTSFFYYCRELLLKYKDDLRIWNIGGYKVPEIKPNEFSYSYSRFVQIWGWATWADRWKKYDYTLNYYKKNKHNFFQNEYYIKSYENKFRKNTLDSVINGNIDTWDYQWDFTVRTNNGLSIRPSKNLITNIGIGDDEATHTKRVNKVLEQNIAKEIKFPLNHPHTFMVHKRSDYAYSKVYCNKNIVLKAINLVKNYFFYKTN